MRLPTVLVSFPMMAMLTLVSCRAASQEDAPMWGTPLTPAEERVIVQRGTEAPYSGRFVDSDDDGTYRCRRCGAPLFESASKFHSGCGWPAFDRAIPGAVREIPDPDGERTEIVCAACGAHLGHVFRGEGFTETNVRHCVNSVSMAFEAAGTHHDAFFAGGCFWGVEYWFDREPGVLGAVSGYMGGDLDNPTYAQVRTGQTGHAETVRVRFDPAVTSYEKLVRLFMEIHDPAQINRQGPDVGHQYRSAIFVTDDAQRAVAERLVAELRLKGFDVQTEIVPAGRFWPAEDYHQDYYRHKGTEPYCHSRVRRF